MISRLRLEFFRVFNVINLAFLIVFFIASLYLVNQSINEYKRVRENNKKFAALEKEKSTLFVTYEQYGVFGYRVKGEADPMIIFFDHSAPISALESKIDSLENVGIGASFKGKEIFKTKNYFNDFFGLLNVFGSLMMFILGLFSYKPDIFFMGKKCSPTKKLIARLEWLLARLLWIDIAFIALMSIIFIFALIRGVPFTSSHVRLYLAFELNKILFLNICYLIGLAIASGIKPRYINLGITFIVWFFCIFVLPDWRYSAIKDTEIMSASELDSIKHEKLMAKEKAFREILLPLLKEPKNNPKQILQYQKKLAEEYLTSGYKENATLENKLQEQMKNMVTKYEMKSLWTPFGFNMLMGESLSSRGYQYYLHFVDMVLIQKDHFFRYYIDKRYNSNDQTVIPITRDDDFLYKAQSILPGEVVTGFLVYIIYSLIFIILTQVFLTQNDKKKEKEQLPLDISQLEEPGSFSLICTEYDASRYLNFLETKENITVIDTREFSENRLDTPPIQWIKYVCKKRHLKLQDVLNHIDKLGIDRKELNKLFCKSGITKQVYLALMVSDDSSICVIYNLFSGESSEFETSCKQFLREVGKTVFYIGNKPLMYRAKYPINTSITAANIFSDNIYLS